MGTVKKSAQKAAGLSAEEVAAVKEYVEEKRRAPRRDGADGERDLLEKIAAMPQLDRPDVAERFRAH